MVLEGMYVLYMEGMRRGGPNWRGLDMQKFREDRGFRKRGSSRHYIILVPGESKTLQTRPGHSHRSLAYCYHVQAMSLKKLCIS